MTDEERDGEATGDTRDVLLQATYRTLAAEGYDALSLRAVADRAGRSRGLVHYHFDSKRDLVTSLLDYLLERLEGDIESSVWTDPEAALRSVLERVGYGPADDDPTAYYRAIFALRSRAPYDPEIRKRLARNYRVLVDRVAAILEAGVDDGTFQDVDPEATAVFLVVAVDGARVTELALGTEGTRDSVFGAIESLVFPGLLAATDR